MDYNGVIGLQPTAAHWELLRRTVDWRRGAEEFEHVFWTERVAYYSSRTS